MSTAQFSESDLSFIQQVVWNAGKERGWFDITNRDYIQKLFAEEEQNEGDIQDEVHEEHRVEDTFSPYLERESLSESEESDNENAKDEHERILEQLKNCKILGDDERNSQTRFRSENEFEQEEKGSEKGEESEGSEESEEQQQIKVSRRKRLITDNIEEENFTPLNGEDEEIIESDGYYEIEAESVENSEEDEENNSEDLEGEERGEENFHDSQAEEDINTIVDDENENENEEGFESENLYIENPSHEDERYSYENENSFVSDNEHEFETESNNESQKSDDDCKFVGEKTLRDKKEHVFIDDSPCKENIPPSNKGSQTTPSTKRTPVLANKSPHQVPSVFTTPQRNFHKVSVELAPNFYAHFNKVIFEDKLPKDVPITWSNRLNTTAGKAFLFKENGQYKGRIELSIKVLDTHLKLQQTLLHEICHLATWVIDHKDSPPHGSAFKYWARLVENKYPQFEIKTCHNYEINFRYWYECTNANCGVKIGRHSKSIDVINKVCGKCNSTLKLLPKTLKDGTPKKEREPSGFSLYLQQNMSTFKKQNPGLPQKELMGVIAMKYREEKNMQKNVN